MPEKVLPMSPNMCYLCPQSIHLQRRGLPWEPPMSFQAPTRFPEEPFFSRGPQARWPYPILLEYLVDPWYGLSVPLSPGGGGGRGGGGAGAGSTLSKRERGEERHIVCRNSQ